MYIIKAIFSISKFIISEINVIKMSVPLTFLHFMDMEDLR